MTRRPAARPSHSSAGAAGITPPPAVTSWRPVGHPRTVPHARNPTLAIVIDRAVLNLSYFTAKGLALGITTPQAESKRDEIDVAIAPLAWREPDWNSVKWCLAAGYPDEHKKQVVHDGTDKVSNQLVTVVAEAASQLGRAERCITLSSTLDKPHGFYFSGMSGGPVYAVEGAEQRTVEDDEPDARSSPCSS